ncbi:hypothetical protein SSX86_028842 [Deinandra increscens subsp. villosa]|uniref:TPX2 C-terminal domain-containing protein n=1 Tax=Deinandra increscens subsp. villosa TaxID=3103831 RepID=A0AAP0GL77_9ASTR
MAGEIEEPFQLNFQANLLQSGSISFGRFESESLSWERRSVFPHNRYLEEVEKYSKPGSVTEKKAYFEAEFRRKALLKQRSSECQDGGESPTVSNSDPHDFEEYGNFNEGSCTSNPSECNTETEIRHHEKGDVACFDGRTPDPRYNEDTTSQHQESQNHELNPVTTEDELGETHRSENDNVAGDTEQSIGLTPIEHVVLVDVSSQANDDSSFACQTSEIDHDSISSTLQTTLSPKVKPAAEKKLTRSTLKTQTNVSWSQKQVLNGSSKGSVRPRTSESKGLLVKATEKKSPRPASPLNVSGVKTSKAEVNARPEIIFTTVTFLFIIGCLHNSICMRHLISLHTIVKELRSEKAANVKAHFPLSEKSLHLTVNRSKPTVNPSKTRIGQSATDFSFKTDQRAENRKEFYTKIAEKIQAKEVEINQVQAKTLEKLEAATKQFRKSLNFKAKPLPSFYNESSHGSDLHKVTLKSQKPSIVTLVSKTPNQSRPSSQAISARHDKNPFKSSVPLNIRPSSSTSSTNRIRFPESVERNQPRPSSQAMSTRHDKNPFKSSVPLNIRPSSSTSSTNRIRFPESVERNQPRPSSQAMSTRHDKNPFKSSVPLNIRPSSSTSSTNRIRFPESGGRNQPRPSSRPSSQAMSTRHDKNPFKSSVPLNIRPGSSTSSTNRVRFPESVGRNHVPETKDKEKGKDAKLNKQRVPEPRVRDMVRKQVKNIHTWSGPKAGIVS